MKTSTVHPHGKDDKYCRSVIPQPVCKEVGLKIGSTLSWSALDNQTLIAKVVQ
ncbi:hypothetical protein V7O62_12340 [Methanolobus sp. ZRKC2]|uniref:hypothetical protein n=1 Tax=Methanolobus sp. ZRKC2 TaxID=3125783 RepID=UPI00324536D5